MIMVCGKGNPLGGTCVTYLDDQFGLTGKTALVTGASKGIGRAIALALARAGATVVLAGRDQNALRELARQVTTQTHVVGFDMADLEQVRGMAGHLTEGMNLAIDILVNNAGTISRAPLLDTGPDDWRAVLTVNLDALFELTRPLAGGMVERGHGKIVNVASILGFQGGINVAAYAASKHAVVGLTQAMSNEWSGNGVNVNAVAPGYVDTDNTQALREDPVRYAELTARIPAGRWGQPDDISGAVLFLCSAAARYVHGHTLVVDGGWLAR
jgi:2-deoxy-D-gluconate 3-dehydrogenase